MLGFFLSALAALTETTKDIQLSSGKFHQIPHLLKAFLFTTLGLPIFALAVLFSSEMSIEPRFWFWVSIQSFLLAFATWLYMKALSKGSVAESQPILALSTVFLVITNPILTEDKVSIVAWTGVLTTTFGIYLSQLPVSLKSQSILKTLAIPFQEIFKNPGSKAMLGVAIIYSITANIDKICVQAASPAVYLFVHSFIISLFLFIILLARNLIQKQTFDISFRNCFYFMPAGLTNSFTLLIQMWAVTMLPVPYVIAIKRCSILFVSFWGYFFRKDREFTLIRALGLVFAMSGIFIILVKG